MSASDDIINGCFYLSQVLKLICMQSVANNGLRPRQLDTYRKEILQVSTYSLAALLVSFNQSITVAIGIRL